MKRTRPGESGAATVEFVLLLPAFLALTGMVIFAGWLGLVRVILDHGAREGLRTAMVPQGQDLRSWPSPAVVAESVEEATPLISPTGVEVSAPPGAPAANGAVTVTVVHEVPNPVAVLIAPLSAIGFQPTVEPHLQITAEAKGRRE